jgi:hypothetical protein
MGFDKKECCKFCGNYGVVHALNKSSVCIEDVFQKPLELYKSKHPKDASFMFIHC